MRRYEEIVFTIQNKRRFGNLPGISISKELLAAVGNPQKELKFVHIAGTNGKGSTAAFLASILKEAGIKAGMFTSPHLIEFTERIQINGKQISKEDVTRLGEKLLSLELDVYPTMFDYCFAMAMLYFKEQGCELVVLETGLGGRLDSTNCIDAPEVSVITKIGYDHTQILGDTLTAIAGEKAGILKAGSCLVVEKQDSAVLEVFQERCAKLNIPYLVADAEEDAYKLYFKNMQMQGKFQRENASAAILAAKQLRKKGYEITEEHIQKGIEEAVWQGRMERVSRSPFLMIDGAHNGHGVTALVESLKLLYPGEKFHFIMGVLADKDYEEMAQMILPLALDVTTVTPESSRALQGEELAQYMKANGIQARNEANMETAFAPFLKGDKLYRKGEKTIAFGSLYFIGDVRKLFVMRDEL